MAVGKKEINVLGALVALALTAYAVYNGESVSQFAVGGSCMLVVLYFYGAISMVIWSRSDQPMKTYHRALKILLLKALGAHQQRRGR